MNGEIFNLSHKNYRILELAHWVKDALSDTKEVAINVDYSPLKGRSYRVSTAKIESQLGFRAGISVRESVTNMVKQIHANSQTDFLNPAYYNIQWIPRRTTRHRERAELHRGGAGAGGQRRHGQ